MHGATIRFISILRLSSVLWGKKQACKIKTYYISPFGVQDLKSNQHSMIYIAL